MFGVWGCLGYVFLMFREVFGCPGIDTNLKIEGMDKGGTFVLICIP